jgi:hypothetical protein
MGFKAQRYFVLKDNILIYAHVQNHPSLVGPHDPTDRDNKEHDRKFTKGIIITPSTLVEESGHYVKVTAADGHILHLGFREEAQQRQWVEGIKHSILVQKKSKLFCFRFHFSL